MSDLLAAVCAGLFIVVLALSAYWDPSIRVLHVFEALPYGLAAVLCLQQRKTGYLLGIASGALWLWIAGTLTTFVRNGFDRVAMLLTTGHVDRWDQFIAAPAALATGGLVVFSIQGYLRLRRKSRGDVIAFVAMLATVLLYFVGLFWLFAPRFLDLFKRLV